MAISAAMFAAYEAHIINVTAHIENSLQASTYGIDFGTVFPQEYIADDTFDIGLSESFLSQDRVKSVSYKIVQKAKGWTLNFGDKDDVDTHNRTLLFVDPDQDDSGYTDSTGVLRITTDSSGVEDLFGLGETFGDVTAPRMVIPIGGNFTVETNVTLPVAPVYYQSGGILVYGSDGNVVRLELTATDTGVPMVYMESQIAGVKTGKGWIVDGTVSNTGYLKLSRNGNVFAGEYSTDGLVWVPVPLAEGTMTNAAVMNQPKVGLSAANAIPDSQVAFSAEFDYVTFNGDYLNLCKFLSKTTDGEEGDISHPSYYTEDGIVGPVGDSCLGINDERVDASGILSKVGDDFFDTWTVDLKVPPVSGYVGQEWPESCADWTIPEDSQDYGCDLWIEVTGIDENNGDLACSNADVMLVLDRSGSINVTNLATLKTAAKDFVTSLAPDPSGVHMGQTSFASDATLDLQLTSTLVNINAAIDALTSSGSTNLAGGILLASTELLTGNDRTPDLDFPDYMVVITDGNPNYPDGEANAKTAATVAADAARAAGTKIYVVGVGGAVDDTYLSNNIANSTGQYYDAADYDSLSTVLAEISTCNNN